MSSHVLLVWTTKSKKGKFKDHFLHFENFDKALDEYSAVLLDSKTYSASICAVIQSSDYSSSSEYLK